MQREVFIRRRKIAIILGVVLLIIAFIFLTSMKKSTPTTPALLKTTSYSGTSTLLDSGASTYVINDMQFAFHQFLVKANLTTGQTIILTKVNHSHDKVSGNDSYTFNALISGQSYTAILQTTSLTTASLSLSTNSIIVFTSGPITLTAVTN